MPKAATCHPEKPHYAHGLCLPCWRKKRRESRINEFRLREKDYYEKNKDRCSAASKTWYSKNKDKISEMKKRYNSQTHVKVRIKEYDRRKHLSKLGISLEQYNSMLAAQGGVCAICRGKDVGRDDRDLLYVDHDHSTTKVRGLLCHNCNFGIGHFKDSPELLEVAAQYLRDRC